MSYPRIRITSGEPTIHGKHTQVTIDGEPANKAYAIRFESDVHDVTRVTLSMFAIVDFDGEAELGWVAHVRDGEGTFESARGTSRGDALRRLAEHYDDIDALQETLHGEAPRQ